MVRVTFNRCVTNTTFTIKLILPSHTNAHNTARGLAQHFSNKFNVYNKFQRSKNEIGTTSVRNLPSNLDTQKICPLSARNCACVTTALTDTCCLVYEVRAVSEMLLMHVSFLQNNDALGSLCHCLPATYVICDNTHGLPITSLILELTFVVGFDTHRNAPGHHILI
jgi:hypothetical protein